MLSDDVNFFFTKKRVCFYRPNSFVIITANRVIHCNTDTPEEMHHWIGLLQKSKGDSRADGQEFLVRGLYFQAQTVLRAGIKHRI